MRKITQIGMLLIFFTLISVKTKAQLTSVSGDLEKWDKITISLDLPNSLSETESTFRNNRMDVLFTRPDGTQIRVPGFFAADGDAANTSAVSGTKYKAILRPDQLGVWNYEVLFYTGTNVAIQSVSELPAPVYAIPGSIGNIGVSTKVIPDLKAKGRLQYQTSGTLNQRRYLRFAETGEYFLKIGPDSPENILNFDEFDFNDTRTNSNLHSYTPHATNYEEGNLTWSNGKGKNIIGVLNFLRDQGMNSFSMSLFGGDDRDVFPWTRRNNANIYDISKLEQWEIVFSHAESIGLFTHFKLAEAENWNNLDTNKLRLFYREMVARFGHHLAIEWNISEEYGSSDATVTAASALPRIDWLAEIDSYNSPRVIHTFPTQHDKYKGWLELNAKLTGASIQSPEIGTNTYSNDSYGFLTIINNARIANQPWVVACDEQSPGGRGVFLDKNITTTSVNPLARKQYIWEMFVAGGAGVMWFGGSKGDFITEDFRRFSTLFNWSRYAVDFFKSNDIEFWNMENKDNLVIGSIPKCLAQEGKEYVIYLAEGGTTELNLSGQPSDKVFYIKWFDPRNGGALQNGSTPSIIGGSLTGIGAPPNSQTEDWVVYVTSEDDTPVDTAISIPGRLEAELGIGFDDQTVVPNADGNGATALGQSSAGDKLMYTINVPEVGEYELGIRASTAFPGRKMKISTNGEELGEFVLSNTGNWGDYEISKPIVNFAVAGVQTLEIEYIVAPFNLDWIEFNEIAVVEPEECDVNYTLEALQAFTNRTVDGFRPAYADSPRQSLAINSITYPDEFAAAETVFDGIAGTYDITLNTLTEDDGESTYRVWIDDVLIGEYQNPVENSANFLPAGTTFKSIELLTGSIIRVAFNATSNMTKPFNGGFDYSRGRFRSLELTCVEEVVPPSGKPIPGRLEAEEADNFDAKRLITNADGQGAEAFGSSRVGDVLSYEVNVVTPGEYNVSLRASSRYGGRKIRIRSNGEDLGEYVIPVTGGWSNYELTTLDTTLNFATAGTQTLEIDYVVVPFNLDYIEFSEVSTAKNRKLEHVNIASEVLTIYPNPASKQVFIQGKKGQEVMIVDITGRKVMNEIILDGNRAKAIDISWLSKGVYFVKSPAKNIKLVVKNQ